MFLKNKWKNLSIKKKLFLWSSLTIIIAFSLLYISMYLFMPKVYEFYKVNNINVEIKELKYELLNNEEIDIDEVLDKFSYENNLDILLVKKDGNNLIIKGNQRALDYNKLHKTIKKNTFVRSNKSSCLLRQPSS